MKIFLIIVLVFSVSSLKAQTNTYLQDLKELKSIIEKTPSFKAQIKGAKLSAYNALYKQLVSDTVTNVNSYHYFYNLSRIIFPLKDNHIVFYKIPNYGNYKNKAAFDSFVKAKKYAEYPISNINIDSLKTALEQMSPDSIEGIYYFDTLYSVGLFKKRTGELIGVVLNSNVPWWTKGEIAIHLYKDGPNQYKAIYTHPLWECFILHQNEKYGYQTLLNSHFYGPYFQGIYSKRPKQTDYVDLPDNTPMFQLRSINKKTQYLLVRTFQVSNSSIIKESQIFYDSIKNSLNKPNLILDLRNNQGGAKKESKKYSKLLKKYSRQGHLYVLVNNGTVSQAEMLVLRLKKLKNTTIVGRTTTGQLTYGSNYGKRYMLPSGKFEIYPTDMKGKKKFLQYENVGINPDLFLTDSTDWIKQVVDIINKE